ncbi:hypothetical protein CkaCkLH20_11753 [Colletotrichum karsti]|uniref:Uncharacterized protein n=1 Tax=Colletotrichum karsti TaxID=1095194 RepID=A0A9P6LD51_9PEZI|nr:uncharacterized protein CkaCkLH20_11753 [Colletotrichum karsti]KAF9870854.1 hypothetical protein CkaCkLH20_11753 [Colletotrichum karsti]
MINTLHHVMMTKSVLDPVPIEHNSCIKHLLEAYWRLQEQLQKTEQDLVEERETKERSLEEFAKMSSEWEKKEADFLAEIKRMEVVLSKVAPDGVGAVVLARSGSIVDRSKRSSKLFKDRIEKAKSPEKGQHSSPAEGATVIRILTHYDKSQDCSKSHDVEGSTMSAAPESARHNHTTYLSMRPNLDDNADAELSEQIRTKQRRRFWGTKYDPRKFPARTRSTTSLAVNESNKGQTPARSTTKCSASGPSQQTAGTQEGTVPPTTPDSASEVTILHIDEDDSSGLVPRTTGVDLTAEPASHQLLDEHPDILTETHEEGSRQDEHKSNEFNRHKREFSFDPGEDGIPLSPLASKPRAVERSTNQNRREYGSIQGAQKTSGLRSGDAESLTTGSRRHSFRPVNVGAMPPSLEVSRVTGNRPRRTMGDVNDGYCGLQASHEAHDRSANTYNTSDGRFYVGDRSGPKETLANDADQALVAARFAQKHFSSEVQDDD